MDRLFAKALMRTTLLSSFLLLFILTSSICAQPTPQSAGSKDTLLPAQLFEPLRSFSASKEFSALLDTTAIRTPKSPGKAILLSALMPGLGQIYTKSYWKLPIIWGLGGYYVQGWIKNNNRYREFRDQYLESISPSNPQGNLQTKNFRDFYRNQRDSYAWYFGILYLANLVDAYVTASLYEFDVSDDLSVEVGRSGQVVTVRWRW